MRGQFLCTISKKAATDYRISDQTKIHKLSVMFEIKGFVMQTEIQLQESWFKYIQMQVNASWESIK